MTTPEPAAPELAYARPYWDETEAAALLAVLNSGMWTNGGAVVEFERALSKITGAPTVAVSSGTTAVVALLSVLQRRTAGPRLLITPTINFAAGPASAAATGWDVALCDVEADDFTISATSLAGLLDRVTGRYAQVVVLAMHYAGHSCDMGAISELCGSYGADLIEDACHAIGASYSDGTSVGSWPTSLAAYFSFHPTKPLATGEGGAVTTRDKRLLDGVALIRNHNIFPAPTSDDDLAPRPYQIDSPGMNLRLSELHAALGVVQARRLPESQLVRSELAAKYYQAFAGLDCLRIIPPVQRPGSAHHLFPVVFDLDLLGWPKRQVLSFFHDRGIRVQIHYTPLHRLAAFAEIPEARRTTMATADRLFRGLVSLPLWRGMTDADQDRVVTAVDELVRPTVRGEH